GYLLAGILIFSVVPGRTPVRDLRSLTSNVPKPVSWTLAPLSSDALICSRTASMMSLTSFFLRPLDSATLLTRSAFDTVLALAIGICLGFWGQPGARWQRLGGPASEESRSQTAFCRFGGSRDRMRRSVSAVSALTASRPLPSGRIGSPNATRNDRPSSHTAAGVTGAPLACAR